MPLSPGDRFGPYELISPLGTGAMGEVWKARDGRLGRLVALKASKDQWSDRFAHEARALAALNHPNIVSIYDIGSEGGVNFLVMELVHGESLHALIERGPLECSRLVQIGVQIADALIAAHSIGLLHRDVKPANILVTSTAAKLTDFGIATRLIDPDQATVAPLTAEGAILGTCRYMSPEQARGLVLTEQSDVFALGAVLYEAATGRPAFGGHGMVDTLLAVASSEPIPPRRLRPELPTALEEIILRALAKDTHARLSSAAALRNALNRLVCENRSGDRIGLGTEHDQRPPVNLPTTLSRFVGRRQELVTLCELLRQEDVRLLTVTGPAGIGKTRLAVEMASAVSGDFADGVIFVALETVRQPDHVLFEITKALQLREEDTRTARQALADHLANRQLLLVLDNFEHVTGAAPLLAELLVGSSHLKMVVTSRSLLRLRAEHHFVVPPLPSTGTTLVEASGVALFLDRARLIRPDFETSEETLSAISEICTRLDGLPLAIELAAARTRLLPPKPLLARLSNRLQVLGAGTRDVPARQQTLRNAIDWSYELLEESEKRLLRQLAAFVGGARIDSVEAIATAAGSDAFVLDSLSTLVDSSLLRQVDDAEGNPRVVMLETIREYALERLEKSSEAGAIRSFHAQHYLDLAELASGRLSESDQAVWLDRLEAEYSNCLSASECLLADGHIEDAFRLSLALWRFWEIRGYWTEGRAQLNWLLSVAPESVSPARRAHALYAAGVLADVQCDFRAARELFERQLIIQREFGDSRALASAMNNLGVVAMRQGDYAAAKTYHVGTLEIVRRCGLENSVAASLNNLGQVALCQGDHAGARSHHLESLAISRRLGNLRAVAWTVSNLGDVAREVADFSEADKRYSESLSLFRSLDDRAGQASCMADLGNLACRRDDFNLAASLYQESLIVFGELGDKRGIVKLLESFATLASTRGRPTAVLRLAGAASAAHRSLGVPAASSQRADLARALEQAREMLGPDSERLWAEGANMALEGAMQYALQSAVS